MCEGYPCQLSDFLSDSNFGVFGVYLIVSPSQPRSATMTEAVGRLLCSTTALAITRIFAVVKMRHVRWGLSPRGNPRAPRRCGVAGGPVPEGSVRRLPQGETGVYWSDGKGDVALDYWGEREKRVGINCCDYYVQWSPKGSYFATRIFSLLFHPSRLQWPPPFSAHHIWVV